MSVQASLKGELEAHQQQLEDYKVVQRYSALANVLGLGSCLKKYSVIDAVMYCSARC